MRPKIHVEVFIASRLLSQRQEVFTPRDLREEILRLFGDTRPGVNIHISAHCVANAPRNAGTVHNYLWRVSPGSLRIFDPTRDQPHPSRADALAFPHREDVPQAYQYLLPPDWE